MELEFQEGGVLLYNSFDKTLVDVIHNLNHLIKKIPYKFLTNEINEGNINSALWAKCEAINMGDETKTKYDYINKRVTILVKEYNRIKRKITKEEYLKIFDKYNLPGKKDAEVDIETGRYFPKAPEGEIYLSEFSENIKNRLSKEI